MTRIALALLRKTLSRSDPRDATGERAPRGHIFDETFSPVYDQSVLESAPSRLLLNGQLPLWLQFAAEVHRRRDEYDAVVTWGERLSLGLMALQRFSRGAKPHVPMMYWLSKPNVSFPIRAFGSSLHAVVTWSSIQRAYAIERLGLPSEKIYLVSYMVDQAFYSPRKCNVDMICSAGSENRDYRTLINSLHGTNLRCHIASDHVRVPSLLGFGHRCIKAADFGRDAGENVTIGQLKNLVELRQLYARSRFVVISLLPSDTNHGLSAILEAMAMGKTVICSRTRGLEDVIQHGVTGIFVPVGDPGSLRETMVDLWNDPERANEIGARARAYIEAHYTLEQFAANIRRTIEASLQGRRAAPDGSVAF